MSERDKRRRKKRFNIKKLLIVIFLLIIGIFGVTKLFNTATKAIILNDYYISSDNNEVVLYKYDKENEIMTDIDNIYRGTKIKSNNNTKTIGDINYKEIKIDEEVYYVKEGILVKHKDEIVKETTKYVRTSVTVYQNETESKIESFIKKGNKIDIIGYDYIDDEGNVNMYKIRQENVEGWVYRKYLVDTESEAKENYNENGEYDIHKDRKYSRELYGGKASTLDYYPYEKIEFDDNPLLKNAKSMYLNASNSVISKIDSYLEIATTSGVNAIVIDIKDGALAYPS